MEPEITEDRRAPLTRERVLLAAVHLADRGGLEALSMRKLGQELGVEAMALYRHVRDKDDLLDGIADAIVAEIEVPAAGDDWQATLRATILSARDTMLRHPWAARVVESRIQPGPATLRYMEAIFGTLLDGGFSIELGHHALHVLGSRVFGFTQDLFDDSPRSGRATTPGPMPPADRYPSIGRLAAAVSHDGGLGYCDDDVEFEFGLDVILDGFDRLRG